MDFICSIFCAHSRIQHTSMDTNHNETLVKQKVAHFTNVMMTGLWLIIATDTCMCIVHRHCRADVPNVVLNRDSKFRVIQRSA